MQLRENGIRKRSSYRVLKMKRERTHKALSRKFSLIRINLETIKIERKRLRENSKA